MQLGKETIAKYFKFVRTWDVTKECPEGSVDEYEFRCPNFVCRLMYHKEKEWEKAHWELDASKLEYPFRNLKVGWLDDMADLCCSLMPFLNVNSKVKELHYGLLGESIKTR